MSFARIHAMTEKVSGSSGSTVESGFDVINATDSPLRIGIEAMGEAKQWVTLDKTQLELLLPPRGQQKIKVSLTLPADVSGNKTSFKLRAYQIHDPAHVIESTAVAVEVALRPSLAPVPATDRATPTRWGLLIGIGAGALALVATLVTVAILSRDAAVPSLTGRTVDQALAALDDAGLASRITEEASDATPGEVIRQNPRAGDPVPDDKTVALVVARSFGVPDLLGKTENQARDALIDLRLRAQVSAEATSESPAGTVISQNPKAGDRLPESRTVALVIAKSPGVPDLAGKTEDEARDALFELRLRARVSAEASARPAGTVISQSPKAGDPFPESKTVALVIARPETPAPPPVPAERIYRNVATSFCLDSNPAGVVYTLGCNGGTYQSWKAEGATLRNAATGLCLDSNFEGKVYTLACNGGDFQSWTRRDALLVNQATGRCLDSNPARAVYTLGCNGGDYQNWR